jgi:Uma2 family endonuclease
MAAHIARMPSLMTADELLHSDVAGKSTELVRGVLVVREPPGGLHGHLSARLTFLIGQHVYPARAGMIFGQDTGFLIARNPDTVRAPDVAFVSADRAKAVGSGYVPFAPDLAVEILSPGDAPGEVMAKVADWLSAGTRLVWVIDYEREVGHIHRSDGTVSAVRGDELLTGEGLVPGFSCSLVALFE